MSDKSQNFKDGYQPREQRGYQPQSKTSGNSGQVQGGYQPPTSEGSNPTNAPPNKK